MTDACKREEERRTLNSRIREVLSRFGRHDRNDGDFHLVDEDSGTQDLKVQLFINVLTVELIEAIQEALSGHDGWTVSFVEANRDGTDMIPLAGIKVTRWGTFSIPPIVWTAEETSEIHALHDALEALLGTHGKSDPWGEGGDYWITDDKWVKHSHMVWIFRIEFLSPALVTEVQQLLRDTFPACVIWFQNDASAPGIEVPPEGMRIFADRIEQDWDRELLRSIFKERFLW